MFSYLFRRDPTPTPEAPEGSQGLFWPAMTRENLTYTVLKLQPEVKKDYRQKDYAFWTHYLCKATQARARAALGNKCVGHSRVQNLLFETVTTIKKIQTVANIQVIIRTHNA